MRDARGARALVAITPFLWTLAEDAGMPSAYRTLTGLAANDFDVHVVLPERGGGCARPYRGLTLHPFDVPAFGLRGEFGATRSPLLLEAPPGREAGLRWKAFLAAMLAGGVRRALRVAGHVRPALTYGILPTGALAAAAVGRREHVPNVTRLFGTHLAPVHGAALVGHAWELAAFKVPAQLVIVTDDGTQGDVVARRLKVPEERFRFELNGVGEEFRTRANLPEPREVKLELGLDPDTALFVFAHHLIPSHHPLVLVDAAGALARDGVAAAIVVAGDGGERAALEEAIRRRGLEGRLVVLGNVAREQVRRLLAAAAAVVSLDELSNLVNSVLEALALGVPVVATDTGGTRRLLADGENSLLLPRPDGEELAAALRRLVEDGALAAQLRAGAAETARARLESWDERMAREARMLREAIGV
jgi:glycosyltransferase involved in cell wall biosynthesis